MLETERHGTESGDDDEDQEIGWDDLPGPVQKALSGIKESGKLIALERETENGFALYEAEYTRDGKRREVELSEDGEYLEVAESVTPSDLPAAVRDQLARKFPGAEIKAAERVMLTYFEIEVDMEGKRRELHLLPNGAKAEFD